MRSAIELERIIDEFRFKLQAAKFHNTAAKMFGNKPTRHMVDIEIICQAIVAHSEKCLSDIRELGECDEYHLAKAIDRYNDMIENERKRLNNEK